LLTQALKHNESSQTTINAKQTTLHIKKREIKKKLLKYVKADNKAPHNASAVKQPDIRKTAPKDSIAPTTTELSNVIQ
jgi:hypothetical protein